LAFEFGSIKSISKRVLGDLKESLSDPRYFIGASPLQALAYAMSGIAYMLHTHMDHIAQYQLMPDTAKGESLDRWAAIFGLLRNPATKSKGLITITGQSIEALTKLDLIGSNGEKYTALRAGDTFHCESVGTGAETELPTAEHLLFEKDPKSDAKITVNDPGILGGSSAETDEELRQRILLRLMHPARGGTVDDYVRWVQDVKVGGLPVAGQVWILPTYEDRPGNVGVTFMTKYYQSPLPPKEHREAVADELRKRTPMGTTVTVFPLEPRKIDFTLKLKNPTQKDIACIAMQKLLFEAALPEKELSLSKINYALSTALKGDGYTLMTPSEDLKFSLGECGVIGTFQCEDSSGAS
jgi:uncharacterized phage protein gp47/JayE